MSIKEAMRMEEEMREPFLEVLEKSLPAMSDSERKALVNKLTEKMVVSICPETLTTGKVILDGYEIEGGVYTIPAGTPSSYIFTKITPGKEYDESAKFACRGLKVAGHPGINCIAVETKTTDETIQLVRLSVPFNKRHLVRDVKLGTKEGHKVLLKDWLDIEVIVVPNPNGDIKSHHEAWDQHLASEKKKKTSKK